MRRVNVVFGPQQRGVTLIELMVGITIGLLVVLAAVASVITTKTASSAQTDAARLQQKASQILYGISYQLRQAGSINFAEASASSPTSSNRVQFTPDFKGVNAGGHRVEESTNRLNLSYESYPGARGCIGGAPIAGGGADRIESQYLLLNGSLQCDDGAGTPQPIADEVEEFSMLYAVKTAAGVQYAAAADVSNWNLVEAVQVCLHLTGRLANNPVGSDVKLGCDGVAIASDGKLHYVTKNVISLRNPS